MMVDEQAQPKDRGSNDPLDLRRAEVEGRLNTILRAARAAGLELGDDPDFDICRFFTDGKRAIYQVHQRDAEIKRWKASRIEHQDLTYSAMNLIDEILGIELSHGQGTTMDTFKANVELARERSKEETAWRRKLQDDLAKANEKADAWQKRAVDAERRAIQSKQPRPRFWNINETAGGA